MNKEVMKIKVLIEIPCEDCHSDGIIFPDPDNNPGHTIECLSCEGTGYNNQKISLLSLKNLLDGGTL